MQKIKEKNRLFFILFTLAALVMRLGLLGTAHHGDLNNNISWGKIAAENGLSGFYGSSDADDWPFSAPNQPPLTIIMFSFVYKLESAIRNIIFYLNDNFKIFPSKMVWFWQENGTDVMVKLPSVLADAGIAWIIFNYFSKRNKVKHALALSAVWLFNPITWYNSSIWGQTDSVVNLLGLIAVLMLMREKLIVSAVVFTASLLFKGSLAIFIPVIAYIALKQKYSFRKWLQAASCVLTFTLFTTIWFHPSPDLPIWLATLYKTRILPGEIGYLTANAFNFWWLVDSGRVKDTMLLFGISARLWGIIAVLAATALVAWKKLRKKITDKKVFLVLALVSLASFLFMTRIHERYMYPFFPFATLSLAYIPAMWIFYVIFSTTHLLNLYNLFWVPGLPALESAMMKGSLGSVLAIVNIAAFLYLLKITIKSKV